MEKDTDGQCSGTEFQGGETKGKRDRTISEDCGIIKAMETLENKALRRIYRKDLTICLPKEKFQAIEEKGKAVAELKKTYNNLADELKGETKKGEIAVTPLRDKLSLSMADKILFDSGSADVKKAGKKVLERVA